MGAAAVAAGAAEAAADARDGGAEQRSLLRVRTGMGIGAMHTPGRAARAHCHITLGRRTGEGKGGASGVAAEAAAGARNGGAEQRPLRARSLLRLRRSAPARTPSIGSRVRRQAWRRGEARRRRRAREWSACGEADGRWPTGDEARESQHPMRKTLNVCAEAIGQSVVGRGGAGRGPGARRRPWRRLGAPSSTDRALLQTLGAIAAARRGPAAESEADVQPQGAARRHSRAPICSLGRDDLARLP